MRSKFIKTNKLGKLISVLPLLFSRVGLVPTLRSGARVLIKEGIPGVKSRIRYFYESQKILAGVPPKEDLRLIAAPYYIDPNKDVLPVKNKHTAPIAIHLHINDSEAPENCFSYLKNIPLHFDLFISATDLASLAILADIKSLVPNVNQIHFKQTAKHIGHLAAMVTQFGKQLSRYKIVGHINTNFCSQGADGFESRNASLRKLLGPLNSTGGRLEYIFELLQTDVKLICDKETYTQSDYVAVNALAKELLQRYSSARIVEYPKVISCDDMMFWAKGACLKTFFKLAIHKADFIHEPLIKKQALDFALGQLIFLLADRAKGRLLRLVEGDTVKDYREYENQHDYSTDIIHSDIKVLSYYLPQFHPTPENDLWHGKGFTEWTKVRTATPLFEGHYQQHIPHADIGYYLLDSPDTLRHQAEMMKKAGVFGQIFYHYWFSGKLILEEPGKLLLANSDIAMPFCFCWANENWTRRWDGNESEVLLGQQYSAQDAKDFIHYLIPFFKDPRYIKVDGRPMLQVYRPLSMPNTREYLDIWEHECNKHDIARPYVVAVLTRGANRPDEFGMDAGVERVLHDWTNGAVSEMKESLNQYFPIQRSVLSYDDVAKFYMNQAEEKDFTYFRSIIPIWDNTARYGSDAYVIHGSTPQRFQEWMESTIAYSKSTLSEDKRFIVVNAWNEWAEGAHLEPDTRYGYSYLNSIGRALSSIPYVDEVRRERVVVSDKKLHIVLSDMVVKQLETDPIVKLRFIHTLAQSSILNTCVISANSRELTHQLEGVTYSDGAECDFILEFRSATYVDALCIEKMLLLAAATGTVVIPNSYGGNNIVVDVSPNGSVHGDYVDSAPMLLIPKALLNARCKSVRMPTDARCFNTYPGKNRMHSDAVVTTIIRFHKSGNFGELRNALFCLYAMNDCVVVPLIAAQDLNQAQVSKLRNVLEEFIWSKGYEPVVKFYQSENGQGDLRSLMLNESLKGVKTHYAAFLDFDDLLMPGAYGWLIDRLVKTQKAVSFGRVYSSTCVSATSQMVQRTRDFEHGYTYHDFYNSNHAPLHSFMLDMRQLDLSNLDYYDDQIYMEDYLLTLQLFTKENADWDSLKQNYYVGDYIHCVDRSHTLAIFDAQKKHALLKNPKYVICDKRIHALRNKLKMKLDEVINI